MLQKIAKYRTRSGKYVLDKHECEKWVYVVDGQKENVFESISRGR
jgi:hypothetical protein